MKTDPDVTNRAGIEMTLASAVQFYEQNCVAHPEWFLGLSMDEDDDETQIAA